MRGPDHYQRLPIQSRGADSNPFRVYDGTKALCSASTLEITAIFSHILAQDKLELVGVFVVLDH